MCSKFTIFFEKKTVKSFLVFHVMKFYMDLMNALVLCQYRPEHSLSKNIKLHEMKNKNTYVHFHFTKTG